jgi:hypothetical protein
MPRHRETEMRDEQVVGDFGVVLAVGVLAPVDGHLEEVVGVGELSGGGAHGGETLQDVVAERVGRRSLLRDLPGLQQGLPRGFVVALEVRGVGGFD